MKYTVDEWCLIKTGDRKVLWIHQFLIYGYLYGLYDNWDTETVWYATVII